MIAEGARNLDAAQSGRLFLESGDTHGNARLRRGHGPVRKDFKHVTVESGNERISDVFFDRVHATASVPIETISALRGHANLVALCAFESLPLTENSHGSRRIDGCSRKRLRLRQSTSVVRRSRR